MIIYNVTSQVPTQLAAQWLQWMQVEHIPAVMASGCFEQHRVLLLLDVDDSEGPTYAVQYWASSKENYTTYLQNFAPELRRQAGEVWGDAVYSFRTLMQEVQ